jgi:hypothetical protein
MSHNSIPYKTHTYQRISTDSRPCIPSHGTRYPRRRLARVMAVFAVPCSPAHASASAPWLSSPRLLRVRSRAPAPPSDRPGSAGRLPAAPPPLPFFFPGWPPASSAVLTRIGVPRCWLRIGRAGGQARGPLPHGPTVGLDVRAGIPQSVAERRCVWPSFVVAVVVGSKAKAYGRGVQRKAARAASTTRAMPRTRPHSLPWHAAPLWPDIRPMQNLRWLGHMVLVRCLLRSGSMHVWCVPAHAIPHRDSGNRHFGLILNPREPARTLDQWC